MIVITTPTGRIGSQVLARLLKGEDPIRVIVRDSTRLDAVIRARVQIIQGSRDAPVVLDDALTGADRLAETAADLLADQSWTGQENLPVFGPDRLSPHAMADVIADVLGRDVSFRQLGLAEVESALARRGASAGVVRDLTQAIHAVNDGIYDADQAASTQGPTDFRTWCVEVLRPAAIDRRPLLHLRKPHSE
jgi:uncharacterized protein YbjT (DUF2867 family)